MTQTSTLQIKKRTSSLEQFNENKIHYAVFRCLTNTLDTARGMTTVAPDTAELTAKIKQSVVNILTHKYTSPISVETVSDVVEQQLMSHGLYGAAKAFILYRDKHKKLRKEIPISEEDQARVLANRKYFKKPFQELQFYDKYSRYRDDLGRRETWEESVERVFTFLKKHVAKIELHGDLPWNELQDAVLNLEVLPALRILQMAGPALDRCHVGAYNCAYLAIDSLKSFSELLYILMAGTGVGFSVESEYVDKLPRVKKQKRQSDVGTYVIEDSTEGWCDALQHGITTWFSGHDINFVYSKIREKGARLKTKGGRASGPEPLKNLLDFTRSKILSRQGQKLSTIDAHDIATYCGFIVQVGGVRRAAQISLSDLDDREMRNAKTGAFYLAEPQRVMANNSAVYEERPTATEFMEEWISLIKSESGERGIFNRGSLPKQIPTRRKKAKFGVNPCGEIILNSNEFCNLSIAVARPDDSRKTLERKVALATILGTIQSTLTDFKYINDNWKKNCEEERLLGVDITGQRDCTALMHDPTVIMHALAEVARITNERYAKVLGIKPSAAITCIKPSGNSSQLLDCSPGLHTRYAKYYIRRFQISSFGPVGQLLKEEGVPYKEAPEYPDTLLFEFPVASPEDAITRHDVTAVEQLEHWLNVKKYYTEHNPSVTIYIDDHEWLEVGNWVYKNWDWVGGISFLPKSHTVYRNAPYEEITKEQYEELVANMPEINFAKLARFEREDTTTVAQDYACVGGVCEI